MRFFFMVGGGFRPLPRRAAVVRHIVKVKADPLFSNERIASTPATVDGAKGACSESLSAVVGSLFPGAPACPADAAESAAGLMEVMI
jgi:hypothetical protein